MASHGATNPNHTHSNGGNIMGTSVQGFFINPPVGATTARTALPFSIPEMKRLLLDLDLVSCVNHRK